MNPDWQEFLSRNGANINQRIINDFGHPHNELLAARDGTIVAPLTHLGLIGCTGNDAKSFLQNQLTSNVNELNDDAAQYSSWCSPKGRMLANFVLYRRHTDYLVLLSADLQEFIQTRLQVYILRSQVKISDCSSEHEIIGLSGPQAQAALQGAELPIPPAPMSSSDFANGKVIRLDEARYLIVAERNAASTLWEAISTQAHPVGTTVWQWLDIHAGIPWIVEATKEAFVPQMVHFDKIGGVSFRKGCYPGQEVIARTRHLGKVKRHLYHFHADSPFAAGLSIYEQGTPESSCGMVANTAPAPGGGHDGLAVILEDKANSPLKVNLPDRNAVDLTNIGMVD